MAAPSGIDPCQCIVMLIDKRKFQWFKAHGVLSAQDVRPRGGEVEVSPSCSEAILSGRTVARLLWRKLHHDGTGSSDHSTTLFAASGKLELHELRMLRQLGSSGHLQGDRGAVPFDRLYTWNAVAPILSKLNLSMTGDEKTLMVAGDEEVALKILEELVIKLHGSPLKPARSRTLTDVSQEGLLSRGQTRRAQPTVPPSGRMSVDVSRSPVKVVREVHSVMEIRDPRMDEESNFQLPTSSLFAGQQAKYRSLRSLSYHDPREVSPFRSEVHLEDSPHRRSIQGIDAGDHSSVLPRLPSVTQSPSPKRIDVLETGSHPRTRSQNQLLAVPLDSRETQNNRPMTLSMAELMGRYAAVHTAEAWISLQEVPQTMLKWFVLENAGLSAGQVTPGANRRFLQAVYDNSAHLASRIQGNRSFADELEDLGACLRAVHWGLSSSSLETAQLSILALARLARSLTEMEARWKTHLWTWFITTSDGSGGLAATCACLRAHGGSLAAKVSEMISEFCSDRLQELFRSELSLHMHSPADYNQTIKMLATHLARQPETRQQLVRQGALVAMADHCMSTFRSQPDDGEACDRVASLEALVEVWKSFPQELPASRVLSAVRWLAIEGAYTKRDRLDGRTGERFERRNSMSLHGEREVRGSVECLFTFLEGLIEHRSPEASLAYKLVVEALAKHYLAFDVRSTILRRLAGVLRQNPSMPVGLVVMPVLERVSQYGWEDSDAPFFVAVAQHHSLAPLHAAAMAQALVVHVAGMRSRGALQCYQEVLLRFERVKGVLESVSWLAQEVLRCKGDEHDAANPEEIADSQEFGWASWSGTGMRTGGCEQDVVAVSVLIEVAGLGCLSVNERLRGFVKVFMRSLPNMQPDLAAKAITLAELLRMSGDTTRASPSLPEMIVDKPLERPGKPSEAGDAKTKDEACDGGPGDEAAENPETEEAESPRNQSLVKRESSIMRAESAEKITDLEQSVEQLINNFEESNVHLEDAVYVATQARNETEQLGIKMMKQLQTVRDDLQQLGTKQAQVQNELDAVSVAVANADGGAKQDNAQLQVNTAAALEKAAAAVARIEKLEDEKGKQTIKIAGLKQDLDGVISTVNELQTQATATKLVKQATAKKLVNDGGGDDGGEALAAITKELGGMESKLRGEVERVREGLSTEMNAMNEAAKQRVDGTQAEMNAVRDKVQGDLEELKATITKAMANLDSRTTDALDTVRASCSQQVTSLVSKVSSEVGKLDENTQQEMGKLSHSFTSEINGIAGKHKAELDKVRSSLTEEMKQLEDRLDGESEETMAKLIELVESRMKGMNDMQTALKEELVAVGQRVGGEALAVEERLSKELKRLREELLAGGGSAASAASAGGKGPGEQGKTGEEWGEVAALKEALAKMQTSYEEVKTQLADLKDKEKRHNKELKEEVKKVGKEAEAIHGRIDLLKTEDIRMDIRKQGKTLEGLEKQLNDLKK